MECSTAKMPAVAALLILSAGLLHMGGCASTAPETTVESIRSGEVGVTDITRRVAFPARVQLAGNEAFQMPQAAPGNALPTYPESLLRQGLPPQAVCLRVSIDRDGGVMGSAPIEATPECPAPGIVDPQFFAAAKDVVANWRFDPAARCTFSDSRSADADAGDCTGADKVAQAVSLAYRFVFEQHEGRGSVRISQ